MKDIFFMCIF